MVKNRVIKGNVNVNEKEKPSFLRLGVPEFETTGFFVNSLMKLSDTFWLFLVSH